MMEYEKMIFMRKIIISLNLKKSFDEVIQLFELHKFCAGKLFKSNENSHKPFQVQKSFLQFEAMTSEISNQLNKKVKLIFSGDDLPIEQNLYKVLTDCFGHLIRNSIDHGIESSETRMSLDKPEFGSIQLICSKNELDWKLVFKDDGAGLNPNKLAEIAVKKQLITTEQALQMSDQQKIELILLPGFSSKANASDISGRGIGMDAVLNSITKLGAEFKIYSTLNKGSEFHMTFPKKFLIL